MRIASWDGGLLHTWRSIPGTHGSVKDSGGHGGHGRHGVTVSFGCLRSEASGKYFEGAISMESGAMSIFGGV